MRDIQFRGMGINGEWHHGNLAVLTKKHNQVEPGFYISNSVGSPFAYQVRPETVGQFTGIKDENGVDVWEGDLALCDTDDGDVYLCVVKWTNDDEGPCIGGLFFSVIRNVTDENEDYQGGIIVIGNIYENPELLKGE